MLIFRNIHSDYCFCKILSITSVKKTLVIELLTKKNMLYNTNLIKR